MQKKLIALAIAGLAAAPAFAQSNVTIYGVADAGIGIGHADKNEFRGVVGGVLSGNRIGFKGAEELGNGLKAVFQLEQGFDIDTGHVSAYGRSPAGTNGTAFSRQAYVGLQGAFGAVTLGRQYAPGYFAGYDTALSSNVSSQSIFSAGAGLTITPNSGARWNNSVAYNGSFSGLGVKAIYSASDNEAEVHPASPVHGAGADDKWGVGVDYANGPVKAGAVYQFVRQVGNDSQREWYIGGGYDFGVVELDASYQAARGVGAVDNAVRLWNVGVIVPVSAAGKVHVNYARITDKDLDDSDARGWTLMYTHALSKRTTGYVAYNRLYNDDNVAYGAGQVSQLGVAGEQSSLFTFGMRHTF